MERSDIDTNILFSYRYKNKVDVTGILNADEKSINVYINDQFVLIIPIEIWEEIKDKNVKRIISYLFFLHDYCFEKGVTYGANLVINPLKQLQDIK